MPRTYIRTVYKCKDEAERKALRKMARQRYYAKHKEEIKARNAAYYKKASKNKKKASFLVTPPKSDTGNQ